jgi:hypothetical protein
VATSLIQLLCRMTKLGWFEDDAYRVLADEARNFLEKGTTVGSAATCFRTPAPSQGAASAFCHDERRLTPLRKLWQLLWLHALSTCCAAWPPGTTPARLLAPWLCRAARSLTTCWACASSTCWSPR